MHTYSFWKTAEWQNGRNGMTLLSFCINAIEITDGILVILVSTQNYHPYTLLSVSVIAFGS